MKLFVFQAVGEYFGGATGVAAFDAESARRVLVSHLKNKEYPSDDPVFLSDDEALAAGALEIREIPAGELCPARTQVLVRRDCWILIQRYTLLGPRTHQAVDFCEYHTG